MKSIDLFIVFDEVFVRKTSSVMLWLIRFKPIFMPLICFHPKTFSEEEPACSII